MTINAPIWQTRHPRLREWGNLIISEQPWTYEVRDTGRLLIRDTAPTHTDALARTCRHIRLAHEMAGS